MAAHQGPNCRRRGPFRGRTLPRVSPANKNRLITDVIGNSHRTAHHTNRAEEAWCVVRVWPGWTMIRRPRCRAQAGTPCCTIASLTACSGHPDGNVCCSQRAQHQAVHRPTLIAVRGDGERPFRHRRSSHPSVPRLIRAVRTKSCSGTSVRRRCPPLESCCQGKK